MRYEQTIRAGRAYLTALAAVLLMAALIINPGHDWLAIGRVSDERLEQALGSEDVAELRAALAQGARAEQYLEHGGTPLMLAASARNSELLRELLGHGARPNTATAGGSTPLHIAAMSGRAENVGVLLQWGAGVNSATRQQVTPLVNAVRHGHTAVAALLLEHGAVVDGLPGCASRVLVDAVDAPGATPELLQLLIAAGADITAADDKGVTPLHAAQQAQRQDLAAVLLKHLPRPAATADEGSTASWKRGQM